MQRIVYALIVSVLLATSAQANFLQDRIRKANAAEMGETPESLARGSGDMKNGGSKIAVAGVKILRDIAYGKSSKQKLDVYVPPHAAGMPILMMVHGGGWKYGDKDYVSVVTNKGTHWLNKGFIFISVNNRLAPDADALEQADDIAQAVAYVQRHAGEWGGDGRLVLMGHSAGAHLVALLAADPSRVIAAGGAPWAGTVPLDSGALNVPEIMNRPRHMRFYDAAFGTDAARWLAASPHDQLTAAATPMLLVCSSNRPRNDSCDPNHALAEKAQTLGVSATVLEEPLSHGDVNAMLGLPGAYTDTVDAFIDRVLAR